MALWRRVGEPHEFTRTRDGALIEIGWSWRIASEGHRYREIRVIVAAAAPPAERVGSPQPSEATIRSCGEGALDAFLGEETPPRLIVVSSVGATGSCASG